ncbi:hypothetical protein EUX98_g6215 [Antrodiella citrinella]|uniref:Amino acid permease/ SLC12A domain-containing protein n=1 Tax=Antrodiella citrinella TaxID=2447956 RepID=A0A4S4MPV0_9APHY|nr:hypothetical protein EUX98_g6215 [Antrodiella citrinella]
MNAVGSSADSIKKGSPSHEDHDTHEDIESLPVKSSGLLGDGLLHRGLSSRQVSMIAIGGTIGTGIVVYVTLLLLGEMATQYPVAGSFNAYAVRFFSPSYGFALSWNYWFNDAVSVASDLTAAQLVLGFWTTWHPWVISLLFWVFLVGINAVSVKTYGELEYWLSSLKVATIVVFIILGICVNAGANTSHEYIGAKFWHIPEAPFVGGFGGFARVFVTASFAFGGTESLGITAGETKNPSRNMPRVVKFVFWRILIFYILSILIIGLNVPWNYPNLSNKTTTTSPFTLIFQMAGSSIAGSFMNTVILTSVLSAGNHALFAGTRVLYGLAASKPVPQAPTIFAKTTKGGIPLPALLATSSISILCFGSSFIGSGQLWGWLQNIVGVSNQIAWVSIGLASWRFRRAWVLQGRSLDEMKFRSKWTWYWGPPFVIFTVSAIIIIQGWSSVIPHFTAVDFVSFYIEIPVMIVFYLAWLIFQHSPAAASSPADQVPRVIPTAIPGSTSTSGTVLSAFTPLLVNRARSSRWRFHDFVEVRTVDLYRDEHEDEDEDIADDIERKARTTGKWRWFWKVFYVVA